MKIIYFLLMIFLFTGCLEKQPQKISTATILIKTPKMKFYDKGFITKYKNHTKIEILNSGKSILTLKIYENTICKSTFECQSLKSFNNEYLDKSYKTSFLKDIFNIEDKKVIFKDKKRKILIKIIKD